MEAGSDGATASGGRIRAGACDRRRRLSDLFWRRPRVLLALLLAPPLLWLGVVYVGSLAALLVQSFFSIDEFSGVIDRSFTLKTYAELFRPANFDIILRTVTMAAAVTLASVVVAFPDRLLRRALRPGPLEGALLPRGHAAALVELPGQGLRLEADPRQGRHPHLDLRAPAPRASLLDALLAIPVIGGNSLSVSYIGTFLVFVYVWLPFMILPMQAALERVPRTLIEASGDLGADAGQTFRNVILPLALPGIVAGSIFTFSLTLGDYIIPSIIGSSRNFIGQAVYAQQGTAGNIPLAAAFAVVPIVIMIVYLAIARRLGAFDAL